MSTPSDLPHIRLNLSTWSEPEVIEACEQNPLLVQIVRDLPAETRRGQPRRIILFIHGLNSAGKTWIPFLKEAFQIPDLTLYDFGIFNYQTSFFSRLLPFQRLPRVEDWGGVLANMIQTTILKAEGYDSFVLVGHSMGGLVSKFALRSFIQNTPSASLPIQALFTYGTPNHGSDRATAIGSLLSPDLALLRAFSGPIHDLQTFWNSRISPTPETPGKLTIPERAVISVKDYWVAPGSGINSLPESFILRLASSHTGLIKPSGSTDPRIRWFCEQLQSIQRQSECSLIGLQDSPDIRALFLENNFLLFTQQLFDALFILDAGSEEGVRQGDKFGLYYEPTEVYDPKGRLLDRIPGGSNMLRAVEVKERVSYCRLEDLVYEQAIDGLQRRLDEQGIQELEEIKEIDQTLNHDLILSLFGKKAVRIPRQESDRKSILSDLYDDTLEGNQSSQERVKHLRKLVMESRKFLDDFPGSVLASGAAFHEAWGTMKMERYEEAEELFRSFCERYPFSVSVKGARDWIEEIGYRLSCQNSGNTPEAQLRLAYYLAGKEKSRREGVELALDACSRKPALVERTERPLRYMMIYFLLSRFCPDMNIEGEMIGDLVERYHREEGVRKEIEECIEDPASSEQRDLLLRLLDSVET